VTDWAAPALAAWAAARGLSYQQSGLLPAASDVLSAGLGAGDHLAGIVRQQSEHSITTTGGFTRRPERYSENICAGHLPGGVEGALAHHMHLVRDYRGQDGSWTAVPETVVLARLPDAARVVRELRAFPFQGEARVGATIDLSGGPGEAAVFHDSWTEDQYGYRFTATQAEAPELLSPIVSAVISGPLQAAPAGTQLELRDGALCVWVRGVLEIDSELDAVCALAAAVASGVARAAASLARLDPASPIGPPADTRRARWIDQGVDTVNWPQPPASVPAARAAYEQVALTSARRRGLNWKVRGIALLAGFMLIGVLAAIDALLVFAFNEPPFEAIIGLTFTLLILGPGVLIGAFRAGREVETEDVATRAGPWGIEAFARGYARSRGMRLEDADEFRRRFLSPLAGVPLKVLFGPLAGTGATGRLVLWIDRSDLAAGKRYLNVAVVAAPAGGAQQVAGYWVVEHAGALVIAEEVPDHGRSLERLDALASVAAGLAGHDQGGQTRAAGEAPVGYRHARQGGEQRQAG
jgi:hypothetical protein